MKCSSVPVSKRSSVQSFKRFIVRMFKAIIYELQVIIMATYLGIRYIIDNENAKKFKKRYDERYKMRMMI